MSSWLSWLLVASTAAAPGAGLRFDALAGLDASKVRPLTSYPVRSGGVLPLRHYPAADAGRVLVLIHGSGSHGRYLAELADAVAAAGAAHVYTPDLRGHGESPERRGDIDHIHQYEEDLDDLLDWIGGRHPGAAVFLGGHSSGGGLALRYAGGPGAARVEGLVLLAPFLAHDAPTMRDDAGGWARPRVGRIAALSVLNGFGIHRFDDSIVIEFAMPETVRDGTETLAYTHRLNTGLAPADPPAELARVRGPLLLLVGADDEAFRAEAYAPLVARHAPEGRVRLLPGVDHLGIVRDARTAELLIGWLSAAAP